MLTQIIVANMASLGHNDLKWSLFIDQFEHLYTDYSVNKPKLTYSSTGNKAVWIINNSDNVIKHNLTSIQYLNKGYILYNKPRSQGDTRM